MPVSHASGKTFADEWLARESATNVNENEMFIGGLRQDILDNMIK
jgi:hypothetical protein